MPPIIIRWLVTTLTVLMLPYLLDGVHVDSLGAAIAAAAILAVLNVLVKPLLILLTLPLTILTLGLFLLVINALLFQLSAFVVSGVRIDSFGWALLAAIIVSLVSWVTNFSTEKRDGKRVLFVRHMRR